MWLLMTAWLGWICRRRPVRMAHDRIPIKASPQEPVVQSFAQVAEELTGEMPVARGVRYYTDVVPFVPMLKIQMIISGPQDARLAHQPAEHVEGSKLIEAAKIYTWPL